MKTLNEIITVMDHVEFCCTNCKLQYECDEVECFLEDALHYLKEYRDNRTSDKTVTENDSVSEVENKPLTLEEMKRMIGKPVFAFDLWYGLNFWHIIQGIDDKYIYFEDRREWPIDRLFCDEPSHLFYTRERKNV